MTFNYFTDKVEAFDVEMDNSSSELIDYFIKQSHTPLSGMLLSLDSENPAPWQDGFRGSVPPASSQPAECSMAEPVATPERILELRSADMAIAVRDEGKRSTPTSTSPRWWT